MPLRSEAQRRFLHAAEGRGEVPAGLAEKYEDATPKSVKARLPMHVKKHATVKDLLASSMVRDKLREGGDQLKKAAKDDGPHDLGDVAHGAEIGGLAGVLHRKNFRPGHYAGHATREELRELTHRGRKGMAIGAAAGLGLATLRSAAKDHFSKEKTAEPDPDRDRQADDEGQMQTDKDRKDDVDSENFYGHGAGVKGKTMNTVKSLMKKKADDTGADLGKALQGVRDNARGTMGAIKPPPGSVPTPKTIAPAPGPGVPAEKKAEDAGADLAKSLQGVKDNAKKTMGDIKPPPEAKPPAVKMGPPQNIKAASAFTNMPNRGDGMFFKKASGREDGMFFKGANEVEGYGPGSVGDAMASNPATGAIGGGMGHGKGVAPAKKAKAA